MAPLTPDERAQLLKMREHGVRLIQALGLSRGTLASQVSTLERALAQVVDVRNFARDRELRVRVRNLRRAVLAIEFELQRAASAADRVTERLAEAEGVTLS